jgi:hypothetical protein
VSGSQATWVDRRIASAAQPVYTLTFSFADGTTRTCTIEANDVSADDLLVGDDATGEVHATQTPEWSPAGFAPLATRDSYTPSASPDGRFMAYAAVPGGEGDLDLYLRRADGLGAGLPLPSSDVDDLEPAFSHDGRHLAHTRVDGSTSLGLTVVDLTTGAARAVPNSAGLAEASWTPDGRLLATDLSSDSAPLAFIDPQTGARATLPGSAGGWAPDVSDQAAVAYAALSIDGRTQVRRSSGGKTWTWTTLEAGRTAVDLSWSHHTIRGGYNYAGGSLFLIDGGLGAVGTYDSLIRTLQPGHGDTYGAFTDRPVTWIDARRVASTGTSDLTGDGLNDLLARDGAGVLWVYPSMVQLGEQLLGPRVRVGANWQVVRQFLAAGDLNADGRGDVLARDGAGVLWLYPGTGRPGAPLGGRVRVGAGWGSFFLLGTGDMDGDLTADVLARDGSGRLWLYPGTGSGGVGAPALATRRLVGNGWNVMNALVGAGDVDYDGRPDLLARDRTTGVLWLYPGNGAGGLTARRSMGTGWDAFSTFAGPENMTLPNSRAGVMVRNRWGELEWHRSDGDGSIPVNRWHQQTAGWDTYTLTG